MSIKTTINIKPYLEKQIEDVAATFKISKSSIVKLLMNKVIDCFHSEVEMCTPVKYQEKYKNYKKNKMHVSYDEADYEIANDLRRLIKKSVSRIIAEAIERFLDDVVRDLSENINVCDNYQVDYAFSGKDYGYAYHFTIYWGILPDEVLKTYAN